MGGRLEDFAMNLICQEREFHTGLKEQVVSYGRLDIWKPRFLLAPKGDPEETQQPTG